MAHLEFKVVSPARLPDGSPDPMPVYVGGAKLPNGANPVVFGGAVVIGGARVGTKWQGCTYTRPPYLLPGLGEIEER